MRKSNTRREIGRKRGLASAVAWTPSAPDADTLRRRALDDARGQLIRSGCTYSASGEQLWSVVRSVVGRTDQLDIVINGDTWRTCGTRRLPAWLRA